MLCYTRCGSVCISALTRIQTYFHRLWQVFSYEAIHNTTSDTTIRGIGKVRRGSTLLSSPIRSIVFSIPPIITRPTDAIDVCVLVAERQSIIKFAVYVIHGLTLIIVSRHSLRPFLFSTVGCMYEPVPSNTLCIAFRGTDWPRQASS